MISVLTMSVNAIINALLYVLKAFFSLVLWFFKVVVKGLKYCFVVLPVTTTVFAGLIVVDVFLLVSNQNPFPGEFVSGDVIGKNEEMMGALRQWWVMTVYSAKGSAAYILMLILTVMMFLPVMAVFLSISVFMCFGKILFLAVVADVAVYIVFTVLGKSFVIQAMDRYFRLFPDAGRRHEEKNYDRLLKKRNRELEEELRDSEMRRKSDFYSDNMEGSERYRHKNHRLNFYEEDYESDSDDYEEDDPEFDEEYDNDYYEEADNNYELDDSNEYDDDYDLEDAEDEEYYADEYEDEDEDFEINTDMFTGKRTSHRSTYTSRNENKDRKNGSARRSGSGTKSNSDHADSTQKNSRESNSAGGSAGTKTGTFDFFAGCSSKESVDKKYKSLVKLYHPDNMDGDTAALQEINVQYAKAKKRFNG